MDKTKKYLQVKNPLKNKALGQKQNKNKAKVGGNVVGSYMYIHKLGFVTGEVFSAQSMSLVTNSNY